MFLLLPPDWVSNSHDEVVHVYPKEGKDFTRSCDILLHGGGVTAQTLHPEERELITADVELLDGNWCCSGDARPKILTNPATLIG